MLNLEKYKNTILVGFLAFSLMGAAYQPFSDSQTNVPTAWTELAKLKHILDQYQRSDLEIVIDGRTRPASSYFLWARGFLRRTYRKGDSAALWIDRYAYRSDEGNIIYFKYWDSSLRPIRDVFHEDLEFINGRIDKEITDEHNVIS